MSAAATPPPVPPSPAMPAFFPNPPLLGRTGVSGGAAALCGTPVPFGRSAGAASAAGGGGVAPPTSRVPDPFHVGDGTLWGARSPPPPPPVRGGGGGVVGGSVAAVRTLPVDGSTAAAVEAVVGGIKLHLGGRRPYVSAAEATPPPPAPRAPAVSRGGATEADDATDATDAKPTKAAAATGLDTLRGDWERATRATGRAVAGVPSAGAAALGGAVAALSGIASAAFAAGGDARMAIAPRSEDQRAFPSVAIGLLPPAAGGDGADTSATSASALVALARLPPAAGGLPPLVTATHARRSSGRRPVGDGDAVLYGVAAAAFDAGARAREAFDRLPAVQRAVAAAALVRPAPRASAWSMMKGFAAQVGPAAPAYRLAVAVATPAGGGPGVGLGGGAGGLRGGGGGGFGLSPLTVLTPYSSSFTSSAVTLDGLRAMRAARAAALRVAARRARAVAALPAAPLPSKDASASAASAPPARVPAPSAPAEPIKASVPPPPASSAAPSAPPAPAPPTEAPSTPVAAEASGVDVAAARRGGPRRRAASVWAGPAVPTAVLQIARDRARERATPSLQPPLPADAPVAVSTAAGSLVVIPSSPLVRGAAAGPPPPDAAVPPRTMGERLRSAVSVFGVPSPEPPMTADEEVVAEAAAWAVAAGALRTGLPAGGEPAVTAAWAGATTLPALPPSSLEAWTVPPPPPRSRRFRRSGRRVRAPGGAVTGPSSGPPAAAAASAAAVGVVAALAATSGVLLSSVVTLVAAATTIAAVNSVRRRTVSRPEAYVPPPGPEDGEPPSGLSATLSRASSALDAVVGGPRVQRAVRIPRSRSDADGDPTLPTPGAYEGWDESPGPPTNGGSSYTRAAAQLAPSTADSFNLGSRSGVGFAEGPFGAPSAPTDESPSAAASVAVPAPPSTTASTRETRAAAKRAARSRRGATARAPRAPRARSRRGATAAPPAPDAATAADVWRSAAFSTPPTPTGSAVTPRRPLPIIDTDARSVPLSPSFAPDAGSPVWALAVAVADVLAARVEAAGGTLARRVAETGAFGSADAGRRGWARMRSFRRRGSS
ncbi:hypothetical protein BU14_0427s0021 [Porphyra umbilicalis]|uniref:Uncharacterized protein n=1 Tax=Porphyra umbilicalis TaxID=2786 RepID=A0A1X6NV93_PORUM|nr:hypothetical protein BU14_0427s0021 [Porphyra umbilicalis]|eukprot:OSX72531.1 hypothetical protein BU14_0427s0021 [Porphyra umbilicalis]